MKELSSELAWEFKERKMKIVGVKPYLVNSKDYRSWVFVRLTGEDGVTGWGECYAQQDRLTTVYELTREYGRYVVGRDSFDIKSLCFTAYNDFAGKRGSMEFHSAVSGIETAMWDMNGKILGVPVYKLLGGKCRDKVRLYANGWYFSAKTDAEWVDCAKETVAKGFTALKFDPFPGPWRALISREVEDEAVRRIALVREAVGPDVELLIECHRRLSPYHALRVAERIEQYRPYWYEEPTDSVNADNLAYIKHHTNLAIVTGECLYTKAEFARVFAKQAADIINPDVTNCGGILALKEIGAMAEAYDVAISPHNANSTTIGLAATVQVSAMMPNFIITEYFTNFEKVGAEITKKGLNLRDGCIYLDDNAPGLGLDLDEEKLTKYPHKDPPLRKIWNVDDACTDIFYR